jgi:CubicO group peptidase (beta-lactamase class C family)
LADSTVLQASQQAIERWRVPALSVATSVAGERRQFQLGCDQDARFRIASITKPMTASLAVQLLDLDESTGIWPDDVRVRHLLAHVTGYGGEIGDLSRFGESDDALGTAVAELPSVERLVPLDAAWSYANTGYWLAGWLAAQQNGSTYEEALLEHVLGPAGITGATFAEPSLAGHGPGAGGGDYPRARRPSGGVVATAADVGRFAEWQLQNAWTNALRVPLAKPTAGVYGLGFFGQRVAGTDVWGHPGSYGGFQSSLLLVPSRDAWFVALTNSGLGGQALREIEDAWFEELLGTSRPVPPTVALEPDALARFGGTYANEDVTVRVSPGGEGLVVQATSATEEVEATARPIGPATFEIVGGDDDRGRFDFPLDGFARFGSRLARRVQ